MGITCDKADHASMAAKFAIDAIYIFLISYDFDESYDDYGYSSDFWLNSMTDYRTDFRLNIQC